MLPTTFADATATADATFNTIAANKTWIKTVESQETFEKKHPPAQKQQSFCDASEHPVGVFKVFFSWSRMLFWFEDGY